MEKTERMKALSSNEILAEVSKIIAGYLPESRIFLFGSRAKGDAKENSDVDIAIDADTKIPLDIIARIKGELAQLNTLKGIDIIDLNRVNTKLRRIVLKTGVNIYDRGIYAA